MVKLGWGTPTLVSLSLGIIIEIPGNIAIVGISSVALPTDEAALIVLQVSFIGAWSSISSGCVSSPHCTSHAFCSSPSKATWGCSWPSGTMPTSC